jgi:hypothetical protein
MAWPRPTAITDMQRRFRSEMKMAGQSPAILQRLM